MADSLHPDDVSSLARRVAEQITVLCPHIPAAELSELSARIAFAEVAHESGVSLDQSMPEAVILPAGNHIVWLSGSSTSAIVLPAGAEQSRLAAAHAQLRVWAHRYAPTLIEVAARGSAALRQVGAVVTSAYQARSRVQ